jgi:hypothetical protein
MRSGLTRTYDCRPCGQGMCSSRGLKVALVAEIRRGRLAVHARDSVSVAHVTEEDVAGAIEVALLDGGARRLAASYI